MIILGIDPGTRRTGFGIIQTAPTMKVLHAGVIHLSSSAPLPERLHKLADELQVLFERFQPQATSVEKIFFAKNADSAFKLGHARGVCLMAAARHKSSVAEYAAKFVKKAVTGSGGASKEHVRLIVTQLLRYIPESQEMDVSDALALAICHAREIEVRKILEQRTL